MRFATKIFLLTLAITVGLSGAVAWVVTRRVTASEVARAQRNVRRSIETYADRIAEHAQITGRLVQLSVGEPQVRADLGATEADEPAAAVIARLRDETFGGVLQRELTFRGGRPAFHVLVDARGRVVLVTGPQLAGPVEEARLAGLGWPHESVRRTGRTSQLYLVLGERLYLAIAVPLRASADGPWTSAYFVAYEINDGWVTHFAGGAGESNLRVVAHVNGNVVARSDVPEASEPALLAALGHRGIAIAQGDLLPLDFAAAGERFTGEALSLAAGPGGAAALAFYSSLTRALAPLRRLQLEILVATLIVLVIAFVISRFVSRFLAEPVEQLVAGTERIARGEFNVAVDLDRHDELGTLARSFNQMAAGLEQRDLIKDTFGKFVDPKIVQSMLDDPTRLKLGGERRVQSVLFADLQSFTMLSEKLSPEQLFDLLNRYLEDAADVVAEHRGIVDKFIGDGVVAFWGPPLEEAHAAQACRAAIGLVKRTARHDGLCAQLGVPPLRPRVGIATGELLVGNIGSKSKYNYTVMGDVANLASRLEGVNKLYGTQLLTTAHTAEAAADAIVARRIDTIRVIGRSEPVELYEILGDPADLDGDIRRRLDAYESALKLYETRRWADARDAFAAIDDAASRAMADRCRAFAERAPEPGWDGVLNVDRK